MADDHQQLDGNYDSAISPVDLPQQQQQTMQSVALPSNDKAMSEKITVVILNAMVNLLFANADVGMPKVIGM
jgi:hypothetical protein